MTKTPFWYEAVIAMLAAILIGLCIFLVRTTDNWFVSAMLLFFVTTTSGVCLNLLIVRVSPIGYLYPWIQFLLVLAGIWMFSQWGTVYGFVFAGALVVLLHGFVNSDEKDSYVVPDETSNT